MKNKQSLNLNYTQENFKKPFFFESESFNETKIKKLGLEKIFQCVEDSIRRAYPDITVSTGLVMDVINSAIFHSLYRVVIRHESMHERMMGVMLSFISQDLDRAVTIFGNERPLLSEEEKGNVQNLIKNYAADSKNNPIPIYFSNIFISFTDIYKVAIASKMDTIMQGDANNNTTEMIDKLKEAISELKRENPGVDENDIIQSFLSELITMDDLMNIVREIASEACPMAITIMQDGCIDNFNPSNKDIEIEDELLEITRVSMNYTEFPNSKFVLSSYKLLSIDNFEDNAIEKVKNWITKFSSNENHIKNIILGIKDVEEYINEYISENPDNNSLKSPEFLKALADYAWNNADLELKNQLDFASKTIRLISNKENPVPGSDVSPETISPYYNDMFVPEMNTNIANKHKQYLYRTMDNNISVTMDNRNTDFSSLIKSMLETKKDQSNLQNPHNDADIK